MKFSIKHEINGRFRIHVFQKGVMSLRQADLLQYYLGTLPGVQNAKVYERTADAVIIYKGDRNEILEGIRTFSYENKELEEIVPANSGRELNREYQEKLFKHVAVRMVTKKCFPFWLRAVYTTAKAVHYVFKGICCLLKGKLEVEVLDATAITVSIIRSDFNTAGSVMFLLGIGERLEEWTHKKSVGELARSMSLNIEKVWQNVDGTEILVPVSNIKEGDLVTVHVGNVIPLDGEVINGEALVNQASMTGESVPVKKEAEHEIEFFSEKALEAILAVPDISSKKGRRDLVFMILLYDTGARIQEMLDLCLNDLHISSDEKYVVLTGKGGKTRLVPLMQKTVEHLHKYLAEFHQASDGNSFLFYVDRKGCRNQMSQDNVSKFIKKFGVQAKEKCPDVQEHLYVHMFRHNVPLLIQYQSHS